MSATPKYIDHDIQVNDINLHYIEYPNPDKPTLILMHGLTANRHAFSGLVHAGLAEDFHLIMPDLRGRGLSDKPAFAYSFRDHAMDILGLLDHLQIEEANIGGHSFGGLLSIFMATHFPKRINKVILLDAAAELNPNTFEMLGATLSRLDKVYASKEEFMEAMKSAKQNTFWEEAMEQYYSADISENENGSVSPIPNLSNIYRISGFVGREPWTKLFAQAQQPTLLLNGVDNYSVSEPILPDFLAKATVKMMHKAQYEKIDGNHQTMLYGSGAKQITKAIKKFLQGEHDILKKERKKYKVAVVGATGLVGTEMMRVLEERSFPIKEFVAVASEKSKGQQVLFKGKKHSIITPEQAIHEDCDIVLFSAGGSTSLKYAEKFAEKGSIIIDNSSAWRMDKDKKLVVPEVNADVLTKEDKIIANPNCSTIQMVVVMKPLHEKYGIKRVVVSTYQSVSGSGQKGIGQLESEEKAEWKEKFYPFNIHQNVLPHIDEFTDNGYTKEEMKMINETQKIMGDLNINVTATTVRVPVKMGHSESVNIEFEKEFDLEELKQVLNDAPGIILDDDIKNNKYPMPIHAAGRDEVFVGRIRRDFSQPKTLNCWIVADNLRKGAATNAVQIAEALLEKGILDKE